VGRKPANPCAATVSACPLLKNKWAKTHFFWPKPSVQGLSSLQKLTNSKTKVGKWAENWPKFDLQLQKIVADPGSKSILA